VRERAEARLADADGTGPELAAHLAAAVEYFGSAPLVIEAPAAMLPAVRLAAPDPARMTFMPAIDHRSGLVVRSADGAVSVDVSGKARLSRAWPRLAIALAPRLEGAE
jgi:vacuolar-type H+-ATPase subunit E/Vma4